MAHELSFEQIQRCKKVFDENKKECANPNEEATMPYSNLLKAMTGLDFEVNEEDIKNLVDDLGIEIGQNDELDFPMFLRIAGSKFKQIEFTSALEDAFKSFDKEAHNYLSYEQMKAILTDYGEKISSEEADRLLSRFMSDKDKFDYKDFVKKNF